MNKNPVLKKNKSEIQNEQPQKVVDSAKKYESESTDTQF